MISSEANWELPLGVEDVDIGLQAAILGEIALQLPWLDEDEQMDVAHRTAVSLSSLAASIEAGFITGLDAVVDCRGYRVHFYAPNLAEQEL